MENTEQLLFHNEISIWKLKIKKTTEGSLICDILISPEEKFNIYLLAKKSIIQQLKETRKNMWKDMWIFNSFIKEQEFKENNIFKKWMIKLWNHYIVNSLSSTWISIWWKMINFYIEDIKTDKNWFIKNFKIVIEE